MRMVKRRLAFLLFILACCCFRPAVAQNIEVDILKSINPQNPDSRYWINTSNSVYFAAGILPASTVIYGFIAGDDKIKHNGYELFLSLGANILLTDILKTGINRERPADRYPGEIFPNSPAHGDSFPSGHTSLAFAAATTVSLQYKKWYITVPAFAWAASVGYSRMYLGKHYPSDIIGGAVVGAGSSLASHWLNKKLFKRYYNSHPDGK